jgi:hypothetical protein
MGSCKGDFYIVFIVVVERQGGAWLAWVGRTVAGSATVLAGDIGLSQDSSAYSIS